MNMLNDIDLNGAAKEQMCINNSQQDAAFFMNFMSDLWCFIGLGSEQSWNYDAIERTREKWDAIAEQMTDICAQSGHPVVPAAEK